MGIRLGCLAILLISGLLWHLNAAASPSPSETINRISQADVLKYSRVIDLKNRKTVPLDVFIGRLSKQDYIILGEYHDSVTQHRLALWLIDTLHKKRSQGSLLLEMLSTDQQPLIDKLAKKFNIKHLQKKLKWKKSWNWQLYGDIVAHPFLHRYALVATNLTKNETNTIMQGAEPINGYVSTSSYVKETIKNHILSTHHINKEDLAVIDKMVQIQQFRDRRMAEKILASPSPSLLLAGNFHAKKTVGVPVHLTDLQQDKAKAKQGLVVLMLPSTKEIQPSDADYVWLVAENDQQ